MTLHATINALAERFAHDLLRALRTASLEEILTEISSTHAERASRGRPTKAHAPARRGGRVRRSAADLTKVVDHIIAIVKASKDGINAEGIRAKLKVARKELPRPIAIALASKKIRKKGEKRATTYYPA